MPFRDPLHKVSVRHKLALMFVGVCLLAFGVGGYLVSQAAEKALVEQILSVLEHRARIHATALESGLDLLVRRTQDFASDGYIRDHAQRWSASVSEEERARLRDELRAHLVRNKLPLEPAFVDLSLVAPDGVPLTGPPRPEQAHAWRAVDAADGPWVSDLLPDAEGRLRMAIGTPLTSRSDGAPLGWLVSWVDPARWVEGAWTVDVPAGTLDVVVLELVDRAGRRLSARTPARSDPTGQIFARSYPIASVGWTVRVETDAAAALGAVGGLQSRFLIVGGLLTLAASLLLIFPMRFLAWPLRNLTRAAGRIRDGDFAVRVPVESEDEIGELSSAFNAMAGAIQERTERLQRTAEDLLVGRRELAFERDRLQAVISSMRDGMIVLDGRGQVVVANRAARPLLELLENDASELAARHRCEGALARAKPRDACMSCLFETGAAPRSCVLETPGGVFEIHSSRLHEPGGGVGRVLVSHDLTDRVAQDERQIHQERLAVLGEVAAVVAHELNNPLAAISMYNQMLAAELDDEDLSEHVGVIQRNVDTAKRTIRELLDYATDATPELGEVDVAATLEDVSVFLRPLRERSGVELSIRVERGPLLVQGDEVQIRQVFVNLVVNAVQALAVRGGRIELSARREGESVVVDVADDGPGIPPEITSQVFRPFFTTKPRGEGTGLGLSTSRRIAEMHGGGLHLVESGPGGTTFRVRLRAAPVEVLL